MYYIRNISFFGGFFWFLLWKLSTNEIGIILSSEKISPQYKVVMGSSWGKSFFWKKIWTRSSRRNLRIARHHLKSLWDIRAVGMSKNLVGQDNWLGIICPLPLHDWKRVNLPKTGGEQSPSSHNSDGSVVLRSLLPNSFRTSRLSKPGYILTRYIK